MDKKITKVLNNFKALPTLTRVDLEIKAVIHHENWKKEKIDIEKTDAVLMEHLCVHYLRHVWFTDYDTMKHKDRMTPEAYLDLNLRFTEVVEEKYPWLAQAAFSQYHRKRRRALFGAKNPLDRRINDLLKDAGIHKPINTWRWYGTPGPFEIKSHVHKSLDLKVLKEIQSAPEDVCMSSDSEYVRKCKEWFIHRLDDVKMVVNQL